MAERGVRQFFDVGVGPPTQRCNHKVAREVRPDACVVYTDSDPRVIAHRHEIPASMPDVAMIEADFREPGALLSHSQTRELVSFGESAGLLIIAVTQFIPDSDDP